MKTRKRWRQSFCCLQKLLLFARPIVKIITYFASFLVDITLLLFWNQVSNTTVTYKMALYVENYKVALFFKYSSTCSQLICLGCKSSSSSSYVFSAVLTLLGVLLPSTGYKFSYSCVSLTVWCVSRLIFSNIILYHAGTLTLLGCKSIQTIAEIVDHGKLRKETINCFPV